MNAVATPVRNTVAVWFDIPSSDFERAVRFYEGLFGVTLHRETLGPNRIGVFPYERGAGISGCVAQGPAHRPGGDGTVVYLNADGALDSMMAAVEGLGGRLAGPVVALPEGMGSFVTIIDTEGNRVGLHAVV